MSDLGNGSISYDGVLLQFGEGTPYRLTAFRPGVASIRAGDQDRVRGDGRNWGRDYKSAPTHEIGMAVLGEGATQAEREADVRRLVSELARVWSADAVLSRSGAVAKLTLDGKTIYGRPRTYTPEWDGLWDGTSEPTLEWAATDHLFYGVEESISFGLVPEFTGGLKIPAVAPFVFGGGTGNANRVITVKGDAPVYPVFELRGPIQDAYVQVVGVGRLQLRGPVEYDQTLTIDCRPPRGIYLNGNPHPGALHPAGDRLSDMRLFPGAHSVLFGGYDPTGTSSLTVRVVSAYQSI